MLIQITNQCDNNCPHCLHNSVINGGHISLDTFDKALLFAKEMNISIIVISGGEPFMHPYIYELCKKITKPFIICSNGNFIKKYNSVQDAAVEIGGYDRGICAACTKKLPSYYHYIWRYEHCEIEKEELDKIRFKRHEINKI